jgi:hypothetical protein
LQIQHIVLLVYTSIHSFVHLLVKCLTCAELLFLDNKLQHHQLMLHLLVQGTDIIRNGMLYFDFKCHFSLPLMFCRVLLIKANPFVLLGFLVDLIFSALSSCMKRCGSLMVSRMDVLINLHEEACILIYR